MRTALRVIAVVLGLSLILGETYRSWGQDRPLVFVIDDFLIGGFLIGAAIAFASDTLRRRAAFAAAWAATSGGLYGSFFGKLFADTGANFHTNIPGAVLTALIGIVYAISVFGMVATIALPVPPVAKPT